MGGVLLAVVVRLLVVATAALLELDPPAKASTARSHCPDPCPVKCPALTHCSSTVLDDCHCCPVCVRSANESCGPGIGVCGDGLRCHQGDLDDEFGKCTYMWPEKCLKANCPLHFYPECPVDSKLAIPLPPPGECCAGPGSCQCDQQKCHNQIPACESGLERVLVKAGNSSNPGECCDQFECRQPTLNCLEVRCSEVIDIEEEECPADSVRPASYVPEGSCCPIIQGCRCRAAICPPVQCGPGKQIVVKHKGDGTPGNCCDRVECVAEELEKHTCLHDGKTYADGDEWYSSTCEQCTCKHRLLFCKKMSCAKPPDRCSWVGIPEGECCPVCMGCRTEQGEKKKHNETWSKDDCTSCSCGIEGEPICQRHMCRTHCDNPRIVPGQCCPICDVCPSLEHCPLRCTNGLKRDDRGCFECLCSPGGPKDGEKCPLLTEINCDKQCAHGYVRDDAGCAACKCAKCPPLHQCYKHCLYGFETNTLGCPVCKCRALTTTPVEMNNESGAAMRRKNESDGGKCVTFGGGDGDRLVERDAGEWWNDGCRHCFCERAQEFCSLISCPERPATCPEEQWVHREGECCESCSIEGSQRLNKHEHTVCQSPGSGRMFVDGETWQLAPCMSCTCRVGQVLCRAVECPPAPCNHPVPDPANHCCSKCPSSDKPAVNNGGEPFICKDDRGVAHVEGSSWRVDECSSCTCLAGEGIVCFHENCKPLEAACNGIPLIVKGRCCPVCSDALQRQSMCSYKESVYSANEQWMDGQCRNCTCTANSQTLCRELQCQPCSNPVSVPGQCCPDCQDYDWRTLEKGNPGLHIEQSTNLSLLLCCLGLAFLFILAMMVIIWFAIRRHEKNKNSPKHSSVLLSSKRAIGSAVMLPLIVDLPGETKERRRSCDGQSESLLSTASDSSTAPSSNVSSGNGQHSDTMPLTASNRASGRCRTRPKSVDLTQGAGDDQSEKVNRSFGSFRQKPPSALLGKHQSCNV